MNTFVLIINEDGEPGKMFGPFEYDDAIKEGVLILESAMSSNEEIEYFKSDGFCKSDDGGGVYLIQPE